MSKWVSVTFGTIYLVPGLSPGLLPASSLPGCHELNGFPLPRCFQLDPADHGPKHLRLEVKINLLHYIVHVKCSLSAVVRQLIGVLNEV